jgi:hypothetical protein
VERIARFLLMNPIANWIADFGFWLHKRQIGQGRASRQGRAQKQAFFEKGKPLMFGVVSHGNACDARVIHKESGEDVTRQLRPHKVTAILGGSPFPTLAIELGAVEIDISGKPSWHIADPRTGVVRELRALEFADGSRVELSAELFGGANASAA